MKEELRLLVEDNTTKKGKLFDYIIQVLILLSLIAFSIETLPNISIETKNYLDYFETFCVVIFSIEYLIRVYVAKKPLKYIFSFYGVIDLMAILPFYLKGTLDFEHYEYSEYLEYSEL